MQPVVPRLLMALLLLGAMVGVACTGDAETGRDATDRLQQEARAAWASLRPIPSG